MAANLEDQADTFSRMEHALSSALEGSEALQAARASLSSGHLDKARNHMEQAKTIFSLEDLRERQSKCVEELTRLENELKQAELKAGLVRDGLEVSAFNVKAKHERNLT
jgi:hypothetical protein